MNTHLIKIVIDYIDHPIPFAEALEMASISLKCFSNNQLTSIISNPQYFEGKTYYFWRRNYSTSIEERMKETNLQLAIYRRIDD
jgi:hypothetical protein